MGARIEYIIKDCKPYTHDWYHEMRHAQQNIILPHVNEYMLSFWPFLVSFSFLFLSLELYVFAKLCLGVIVLWWLVTEFDAELYARRMV